MSKRLFKIFGLVGVTIFIPLCAYAEYSVITPESPWGSVVVWPHRVNNPSQWREVYGARLDSAVACGLSWNRPNCMLDCEPSPGDWQFEPQDSLVTFMQEHGMNLCAITGPPLWRDSTEWEEYWLMQVEHFDGDGQGYGGV